MARPTKYKVGIADKVCERLAAGESMRSIARDKNMPAASTLFKWLREHKEFSEQYANAKEESADALVEDMLDIADNQVAQPLINPETKEPILDGKGNPIMHKDAVSVNHARLRVDTRKWAASKLKPKKYGDKIVQEVTGQDGGPIKTESHVITSDMDQEKASELYKEMLGNGL